ncbi:MAG: hypothetical protein MJ217_02595 [Bacilli bacterium]|nr:hypothetical protein [Bacilli bacterium]
MIYPTISEKDKLQKEIDELECIVADLKSMPHFYVDKDGHGVRYYMTKLEQKKSQMSKLK